MKSARHSLLELLEDSTLFDQADRKILPLQIEAAREYFREQREKVQVLHRRAEDTGINEIRTPRDIVPLLFSHTTYKSYPNSFVEQGRWDRMLRWFASLSAVPVNNVELDGIKDIDDWIDRLWKAGHLVVTTSGTSGKVSVLQRAPEDQAFFTRCFELTMGWPTPITPKQDRHFLMFGPRGGSYAMTVSAAINAQLYGRPDSIHYLIEEPLRVARVARLAQMRRKMADGSASPSDIATFQQEAAEQVARTEAGFERLTRVIVERRSEPMYIQGAWTQLWTMMERAHALGMPDGALHPDSLVLSGGGLKGVKLPADWHDQLSRFFAGVHIQQSYGMTEMSKAWPRCEAGRFHRPPWIIPLILDATGETLLESNGAPVTGRFGFLDLSFVGRWGGLITGDRVTFDTSDECPCGRRGATVLPTIARYSDLGEEDKIGCAGTIDGYIRGMLAAE